MRSLQISLIILALTLPTLASADTPETSPTPKVRPAPTVVFTGGFKGGVNMSVMPEPDEDTLNLPIPSLFGVGGGGGIALSALAWDIVGLELDLIYASTNGSGEIDFGSGFEVKQSAHSTELQTALLLKVQYPDELAKPFFGIGANFVHQFDATFEVEDDRVQVNTDVGDLERSYTGLLIALGVVFDLDPIRLPFELRGMYHPVDTDPNERAKFETQGNRITGLGAHSDWAYQLWLMGGVEFAHGL